MKFPFKLSALVACLALSACSAGDPPNGYLTTESEYQVAFVWHPVNTREELRSLYEAGGGVMPGDCDPYDRRDSCELTGFTARASDGTQHVYTLRPVRVDDDTTLTLGHEVMHVVLGSYHQ